MQFKEASQSFTVPNQMGLNRQNANLMRNQAALKALNQGNRVQQGSLLSTLGSNSSVTIQVSEVIR